MCQECPANQIQSSDGYSCVACDTSCQNCGGYKTDIDQYGVPLQTYSCITCQATTSILQNNNKCTSCKPFIFVESDTVSINTVACNQQFIQSAGILILNDGSISETSYDFTVYFGSDSFTSAYFSANLVGAYLTCQKSNRRNVTSCQALGNLCVLKLYANAGANTNLDACNLFQKLVASSNQIWGPNLPWLIYQQTLTVYKSSYDLGGIGNGKYLSLQYDNR